MAHIPKNTQSTDLRTMNEALLLGSVRQHELAEVSDNLSKQLYALNIQLHLEVDERQQVEATLRASEERFRTLFDLEPIGIYTCDASGLIQDFNAQAAELWGRRPIPGDPAERFCGSFKMFRPDGSLIPHEQCPMADVVSGRIPEVHDGEVIVSRPDGSQITVIVNIRQLKDQFGGITGAINCFYDITERKRNEAAVLASEARYRTLFNSIDEGFCVIEKVETVPGEPSDFRYLEANPGFERQTGIGGVVGNTIRGALPQEPQEWFDTYDAILKDGKPLRFERILVTTGRVLELYAFRVEDGTDRRVAVIFKDITARKHAERLAQRLGAIVESSTDAIISKTLDSIITSWNQGAETLFGYSAEEAIGKSITMLMQPEKHAEEREIMGRIGRGERVENHEAIRQRKDGSTVWVSLTVSPLKDGQGRVIGASKIARDMTERRRADEHRAILVAELNHRAKNLLAMVQAIASQTLSNALSLGDAKLAFESRLGAMARGHDLLTFGNWAGTDLASVIKATVEPHGGGENRFHIKGPLVKLTPATALTFTMALHELCTNAAKYGALSRQNGSVTIIWQVTDANAGVRLQLSWTETGGPLVSPPSRKGFGSRLIERALAMELGGEVRIDYEPSGVICKIDVPLPSGEGKADHNAVH